ncbi:hypothetical protein TRFO_14112 [Tritrichomonas foetus]|uniref:Uncharacterized protein n=1 Tax=Tritrichomonas foetus TaxID=1144522 RepID=A0A1J4L0A4_9EUKA|nr:hypothetical protein TRFO_14112 [Tritrichomonas foetus]|eukprot:OHT15364.1 hypothetical protein TRFO_14112 [Tritrichomonas foetus]
MKANQIIREMGSKPAKLLSLCNSDICYLRNSLIQSSRTIILSRFIHLSKSKQNGFPFGTSSYNFILNPNKLSPFLGLSQFTQNTSFLLSFLFDRPDLLAVATISIVKQSSFSYMINCIIPSIYGYFSCKEFTKQSIRFYIQAIEKSNSLIAIQILQPFFHSCITFQFFETLFSRFFRAIIIDEHIVHNTEMYIPIYAQFLVECIIESLPLIPDEVFHLLKYINAKKWSQKDLKSLLIDNFLWVEIDVWLSRSPAKVLAEFVQKITQVISIDKNSTKKIITSFFLVKSIYLLPSIYASFDQQYTQYFLCCYDMKFVAKILSAIDLLPESVSKKEFIKLSKNSDADCFYCNVYPRLRKQSLNPLFRPLFFENHDIMEPETQVFEKFLTLIVYKKEIQNADEAFKRFEAITLFSFIDNYVKNKPLESTFTEIYNSLHLPNLKEVRKYYFLKLIDVMYDKWLGEYAAVLYDFNKLWEVIVKELKNIRNLADIVPNIRKFLQPLLIDSVRLLTFMDGQSIYDKFTTMMNAFGFLTTISESEEIGNDIFEVAFQQIKGKELMSSYFIISSFAMRNETFKSLCSDFEIHSWEKISIAIQSYLHSSVQYMTVYNTINEYLCSIYSRVF